MKRLEIMCATALIGLSCMAQIKYDVTVKGEAFKTQGVKLTEIGINESVLDSAEAKKNGSIHLTGKVEDTKLVTVGNAIFFLDDKPLVMEVSGKEYKLIKASDLNKKFKEDVDYLRSQKSEKEFRNALTALLEKNKQLIEPAAFIVLGYEMIDNKYLKEYLEDYPFAQSSILKDMLTFLNAGNPRAIGAKVLDLTMKDIEGQNVHLTDYVGKGNYVLVDFWASWCGPCRAEIPSVKVAYDTYKGKGFDVVGISLDNKQQAWESAVKSMGMEWKQMSDLKGWQSNACRVYRIQSIPSTILYDPEGQVIATDLRGNQIMQKLKEVLKDK